MLLAFVTSHAGHIIGDVTGIVFCLAVAYFAYGLCHDVADLFSNPQGRVGRYIRAAMRVFASLLLYVIACLYALEFVLLRAERLA